MGAMSYMMEVARWAKMLSMVCLGCCLKHGDDHEYLDIDVVLLRNYNDLVFSEVLLRY